MKKIILFFAILFIANFIRIGGNIDNCMGQPIYYQWNPVSSPVTGNLNSIFYVSPALLVSGNSGTILYSTNLGVNWVAANTGVTANLYSVYGSSVVFAAGAGGTIISSSNSGLNWSTVTSPTANNINAVSNLLSPSYKIICGDGGKIFTSANTGTNWAEVPSGTTNSLRCINYNGNISFYRGYVCGDNGTFLKLIYTLPIPPAVTVIPYSTGVSNNFYGVSALGDTSKIMLIGSGGKILKSVNGGLNWVQQTSGTSNTLRYIYSASANDIWVCGDNGTVLHTTNGGTNWMTQVVGSSANLSSLYFVSNLRAIAVGSGGTILECNFPPSDSLVKRIKLDGNSISAYFQSTGIFNQNTIIGNQAGFEWPRTTGKTACFTSGLSISAMVNGNLRQAMCTYKGEYWLGQIVNGVPQTPAILNKIWKVSAGDNCYNSIDWANWGMVVPYGAPYRDMNNNGQYDPCIDIPGMRNASQTIFMALTDGYTLSHYVGEGYGGGTLPLNADLKITAYCYNDSVVQDVQYIKFDLINRGSVAWNNVYMALIGDFDLGDPDDDYYATDSARNMWIGYNGDNMDGSGNGTTYGYSPPAFGMRFLKFPVNKSVYPFDTLRTNAGNYFTCTSCMPPPCESDPNGEPMTAYNFMKGFKKDGSNWMNPMFTPPRATKFVYTGEPEPNTGWTELKGSIWNCGGDTGVYHTTNSPGDRRFMLALGKDNFTMPPGDSQTIIVAQMIARGTSNLNSVTKLKQLADLVANYTVGIKPISTVVPDYYALEQNYPNPFNQMTNIKYQITDKGKVSLRVYDVSGREVATLVNEELGAGTYQVRFDAGSLASGVYFYRLQSGDFVETRKLILLK